MYKTVCAQMADDVVRGHSACLIVAGPPQSGKRFSLVGKLGEFVGMGLAPRLASDILDRMEHSADGPLSCKIGIYQVRAREVAEYVALKPPPHPFPPLCLFPWCG